MIIVINCLFYSLDSIELINQIFPYVIRVPNDIIDDNPLIISERTDYSKLKDNNWTSITVNERLFERRTKELLLNNYPHIQFIHIHLRILLI